MTDPDLLNSSAVTGALAAWRRPLLLTHAKPDGDALGALIALRSLLRSSRCDPLSLLFEALSPRYEFLNRLGRIGVLGEDVDVSALGERDSIIILDTCTYGQLGPIADWLKKSALPILAVDHHVTRDDLANFYLIDESASATCLILVDWARAAGWSIDAIAAEALFVGIAADTGWFRHSNTDARTLAAAGDLAASGVQPHKLAQALFQQDSAARVRLLATALSTLELFREDRLAVMMIPKTSLIAAGAVPSDTEDFINEPLRIASVAVSLLFVEQEPDLIRVSFRSKPPPSVGGLDVDVAALSGVFGGGGHRRAAGARVKGNLVEVRERVIEAARRLFR